MQPVVSLRIKLNRLELHPRCGSFYGMMGFRALFLLFTFTVTSWTVQAQKTVTISGIIVDSVSLVALSNVQVRIKSKPAGITAGASGIFRIQAPVFDTLIFSYVGYKTFEYPVLLSEEDVLIRLSEAIVMLPEVTTVGARLPEVTYEERRVVRTLSVGEGIFSPFTYLSKSEHEKRKLVRLTEENTKIRTYVQVVNDPELKKDMMNKFSITDSEYYTLLAAFNQRNKYVQYLVNEQQILKILESFIQSELRLRK